MRAQSCMLTLQYCRKHIWAFANTLLHLAKQMIRRSVLVAGTQALTYVLVTSIATNRHECVCECVYSPHTVSDCEVVYVHLFVLRAIVLSGHARPTQLVVT